MERQPVMTNTDAATTEHMPVAAVRAPERDVCSGTAVHTTRIPQVCIPTRIEAVELIAKFVAKLSPLRHRCTLLYA
jgi:hypothetical protein